tara:strand:- start:675 stop:896 length:222 start_codon:yes stop_codon:yes gene_type:complete
MYDKEEQFRLNINNAFKNACMDGFGDLDELTYNYRKYYKSFVGVECEDPRTDVLMFLHDLGLSSDVSTALRTY